MIYFSLNTKAKNVVGKAWIIYFQTVQLSTYVEEWSRQSGILLQALFSQ